MPRGEYEIYYRDLKKDVQESLKAYFEVNDVEKETNWDVFPIAVLGY